VKHQRRRDAAHAAGDGQVVALDGFDEVRAGEAHRQVASLGIADADAQHARPAVIGRPTGSGSARRPRHRRRTCSRTAAHTAPARPSAAPSIRHLTLIASVFTAKPPEIQSAHPGWQPHAVAWDCIMIPLAAAQRGGRASRSGSPTVLMQHSQKLGRVAT